MIVYVRAAAHCLARCVQFADLASEGTIKRGSGVSLPQQVARSGLRDNPAPASRSRWHGTWPVKTTTQASANFRPCFLTTLHNGIGWDVTGRHLQSVRAIDSHCKLKYTLLLYSLISPIYDVLTFITYKWVWKHENENDFSAYMRRERLASVFVTYIIF